MLRKFLISFVLLGVVVISFGLVVYQKSEQLFERQFDVAVASIVLPDGENVLEEGKRLYLSRGCVDCHGENLAGKIVVDDPAAGVIAGRNLTKGMGGLDEDYSTENFVLAVRHGLNPDKKPLRFMPSQDYAEISDEQLATMIAYIKSMPPIDNVAPLEFGPVIRLMLFLGKMPIAADIIDHQKQRAVSIEPEVSVAYGEYLAKTCVGCHGEQFSGGQVPGTPPDFKPAANLTPHPETGLANWTEEDFFRALREGKRPDGSDIDEFMPWKAMVHMTDLEIQAMWLYLQTLPAKEYGNR